MTRARFSLRIAAPFRLAQRALPAVLLAAGLGIGLAAPAHADMFPDNEARRAILDLRNQVAQNQQATQAQLAQQAQQIQQIRNSLLDLSNQIEQMRGEIAQVRGKQDAATQQLNDALGKLQTSQQQLTQRLKPLEPVQVQINGQSYTVQPAEKAAFDQALATFRNGDFAGSATQLKAFLAQYPASPYDADAQYWLANAQYAQKQYKDAIATFQGLIQSSPNNPRLPEAMLGLANCQIEVRQIAAARKTLSELVKTYPQSEAAQAGRDRLAKLR
ncbi:MAG: tol-pal system protein YbgF [Thiomonas sp.]